MIAQMMLTSVFLSMTVLSAGEVIGLVLVRISTYTSRAQLMLTMPGRELLLTGMERSRTSTVTTLSYSSSALALVITHRWSGQSQIKLIME